MPNSYSYKSPENVVMVMYLIQMLANQGLDIVEVHQLANDRGLVQQSCHVTAQLTAKQVLNWQAISLFSAHHDVIG